MFKRLLTAVCATGFVATAAAADPTWMLGGTISFGGNASPELGLTAKILSSDQRDDVVGALGVIYYPGSGKFGADAGIGYLGDNNAVVIGYDFLQQTGTFSLGYADVDSPSAAPPPPPPPPPIPIP